MWEVSSSPADFPYTERRKNAAAEFYLPSLFFFFPFADA